MFGVTSCTHSRDVGVKCEGIATVNVYVHAILAELPYLVKAFTPSHLTVCEVIVLKKKHVSSMSMLGLLMFDSPGS